jgi:hypothetical protein
MICYLTSISTNEYEIENRIYKTFNSSLNYIYENLKSLTKEVMPECDFFDRDYIKEYFTDDKILSTVVNCRTKEGEFAVNKVKDNKYMFLFQPSNQDDLFFFVCELEILELLE